MKGKLKREVPQDQAAEPPIKRKRGRPPKKKDTDEVEVPAPGLPSPAQKKSANTTVVAGADPSEVKSEIITSPASKGEDVAPRSTTPIPEQQSTSDATSLTLFDLYWGTADGPNGPLVGKEVEGDTDRTEVTSTVSARAARSRKRESKKQTDGMLSKLDPDKLAPSAITAETNASLESKITVVQAHVQNWIRIASVSSHFGSELNSVISQFYPSPHVMLLDDILACFILHRPELLLSLRAYRSWCFAPLAITVAGTACPMKGAPLLVELLKSQLSSAFQRESSATAVSSSSPPSAFLLLDHSTYFLLSCPMFLSLLDIDEAPLVQMADFIMVPLIQKLVQGGDRAKIDPKSSPLHAFINLFRHYPPSSLSVSFASEDATVITSYQQVCKDLMKMLVEKNTSSSLPLSPWLSACLIDAPSELVQFLVDNLLSSKPPAQKKRTSHFSIASLTGGGEEEEKSSPPSKDWELPNGVQQLCGVVQAAGGELQMEEKGDKAGHILLLTIARITERLLEAWDSRLWESTKGLLPLYLKKAPPSVSQSMLSRFLSAKSTTPPSYHPFWLIVREVQGFYPFALDSFYVEESQGIWRSVETSERSEDEATMLFELLMGTLFRDWNASDGNALAIWEYALEKEYPVLFPSMPAIARADEDETSAALEVLPEDLWTVHRSVERLGKRLDTLFRLLSGCPVDVVDGALRAWKNAWKDEELLVRLPWSLHCSLALSCVRAKTLPSAKLLVEKLLQLANRGLRVKLDFLHRSLTTKRGRYSKDLIWLLVSEEDEHWEGDSALGSMCLPFLREIMQASFRHHGAHDGGTMIGTDFSDVVRAAISTTTSAVPNGISPLFFRPQKSATEERAKGLFGRGPAILRSTLGLVRQVISELPSSEAGNIRLALIREAGASLAYALRVAFRSESPSSSQSERLGQRENLVEFILFLTRGLEAAGVAPLSSSSISQEGPVGPLEQLAEAIADVFDPQRVLFASSAASLDQKEENKMRELHTLCLQQILGLVPALTKPVVSQLSIFLHTAWERREEQEVPFSPSLDTLTELLVRVGSLNSEGCRCVLLEAFSALDQQGEFEAYGGFDGGKRYTESPFLVIVVRLCSEGIEEASLFSRYQQLAWRGLFLIAQTLQESLRVTLLSLLWQYVLHLRRRTEHKIRSEQAAWQERALLDAKTVRQRMRLLKESGQDREWSSSARTMLQLLLAETV